MQETVDEICKSLSTEPEKWVFDTNTFHHKNKFGKQEFWDDSAITKLWTGNTTEVVFSYNQGKQIKEAYKKARQSQASTLQNKLKKW
jgi:hypothetical protein